MEQAAADRWIWSAPDRVPWPDVPACYGYWAMADGLFHLGCRRLRILGERVPS